MAVHAGRANASRSSLSSLPAARTVAGQTVSAAVAVRDVCGNARPPMVDADSIEVTVTGPGDAKVDVEGIPGEAGAYALRILTTAERVARF
eukprot:tig00021521_g22070.t1